MTRPECSEDATTSFSLSKQLSEGLWTLGHSKEHLRLIWVIEGMIFLSGDNAAAGEVGFIGGCTVLKGEPDLDGESLLEGRKD